MVNLISYNIIYGDRFINDRTDLLKIHYKCNFDIPTKVKIYLSDFTFNTESQYQLIIPHKNTWWTSFSCRGSHILNHDKQITNSFIEPLKLTFINDETDEVINEFKLDFKLDFKS